MPHRNPALTSATAVVAANRGEGKLLPARTKVAAAAVNGVSATVTLTSAAITQAWRTETVGALKDALGAGLGAQTVAVLAAGRPLDDYVPPFLRKDRKPREGLAPRTGPALVRRANPVAPVPEKGLAGRNIVVWPSHGVYFANKQTLRWEWQRPRMFTIVEDMLPMSFVNPYIIPMLENAGATVFSARERDFQVNEVVVDDGEGNPQGNRFFITGRGFQTTATAGFCNGLAPYQEGVNPHSIRHHAFFQGRPGHYPGDRTMGSRNSRRGRLCGLCVLRRLARLRDRCALHRAPRRWRDGLPRQPARRGQHLGVPRHIPLPRRQRCAGWQCGAFQQVGGAGRDRERRRREVRRRRGRCDAREHPERLSAIR